LGGFGHGVRVKKQLLDFERGFKRESSAEDSSKRKDPPGRV
jgi:hypothetical protein